MSTLVEIYCDFDGTITRGDTIDVILERLADPAWVEVEDRWVKGEIGSKECMAMQVPLIRGGWPAVMSVLDDVKIDPTFPKFAAWCRRSGISLKIVSDGLDRVIHHILKREKIHVDNVWANHLVDAPDGSLQLTFPYAPKVAGCASGLCKCQILANGSSRYMKVVIGDGRSDFCWVTDADMVFAKSRLLKHCKSSSIKAHPYEDFNQVRVALQEELQRAPSESQLMQGFLPAV